MSDITIITAFFDIGRGNINRENTPSYMTRTTDTYFEYFSNLATLGNEMVIFTSPEFVEKITNIRLGKPTKVIVFDFHNKLNYIKKRIAKIQQSQEFIGKVNPKLLNNIEYWSAEYVAVTNLKTYFVNKAISENLVHTKLVAWVDFGYVRSLDTLNNVKNWQYDFDNNKINFFSIKKQSIPQTYQEALEYIFNNKILIIGGATVGNISAWKKFLPILLQNQKEILNQNIIDDDQGLYMMCLFKQPSLFKLNYLGKKQWFSLFKKYDNTANISLFDKIKNWLI